METWLPVIVSSQEYINAGNRYLETQMRGTVVIQTNDPRRAKEVQPDPGPTVTVCNPKGKWVEMDAHEFLDLVNAGKAKKRMFQHHRRR
jgi:hypothetical protein